MNNSIFISYSHSDDKWLKEIRKHLSVLEHNHQLDIWDDSRIITGSDWRKSIESAILKSKVAVLLVSANFLQSEFIARHELPKILALAEKKGVKVFNIIIGMCAFHFSPLERFQTFNDPNHPIEELRLKERNRVFVRLTGELLNALELHASKESKKTNHHNDISGSPKYAPFETVLVLSALIGHERTITELEQIVSLKRKQIFATLEALLQQELIVRHSREAVYQNQKPSVIWKASNTGLMVYDMFQKTYSKLSTLQKRL